MNNFKLYALYILSITYHKIIDRMYTIKQESIKKEYNNIPVSISFLHAKQYENVVYAKQKSNRRSASDSQKPKPVLQNKQIN